MGNLKHVAGGEISLRGDQLTLPNPLPLPAQRIRLATPYAVRGHMNYCTFCYTAAFWGWPEWERDIDRMAMNGVNTPLMAVGNEQVWQNTLRRLGYREEDIARFIPGCAFTAWWLMGNLEGEGGPVSQAMMDRETALAQKILARMRAYGMEPIQQGFCGLVPTTFSAYFPAAKVIPQGQWAGGYVRPSVLSPLDQMFPQVAAIWHQEQEKLYGKAKYFGGDLFHEGGAFRWVGPGRMFPGGAVGATAAPSRGRVGVARLEREPQSPTPGGHGSGPCTGAAVEWLPGSNLPRRISGPSVDLCQRQ